MVAIVALVLDVIEKCTSIYGGELGTALILIDVIIRIKQMGGTPSVHGRHLVV